MIQCEFEKGYAAQLRHVVTHALVEKDGAILVGKRAGDILESGKWGLPGGFLDRDETAEEGVLRELREETGWNGEVVGLFQVNTSPDRPYEDRQNVCLEFIVRPIAQVGGLDHETSEIVWMPFDNLIPYEDFAFDHGSSIKQFVEYCRKPYELPIVR